MERRSISYPWGMCYVVKNIQSYVWKAKLKDVAEQSEDGQLALETIETGLAKQYIGLLKIEEHFSRLLPTTSGILEKAPRGRGKP